MQLYLDSSALVKLVVSEAESGALRTYLAERRSDVRLAAALVRTEVVRAVAMHRSIELVETARSVIARLHLVPLNNRLLDAAAITSPPELRTLDAIHLAAAMTAPPSGRQAGVTTRAPGFDAIERTARVATSTITISD